MDEREVGGRGDGMDEIDRCVIRWDCIHRPVDGLKG